MKIFKKIYIPKTFGDDYNEIWTRTSRRRSSHVAYYLNSNSNLILSYMDKVNPTSGSMYKFGILECFVL